ncbi:bifunctional diguanylate cyclase/phosphodiesterase [Oscillospiraceae bacterium OttesenSCG-928-G22]|nr:bifunctional diguanylate cyclase/phosphodiesterase [Oscillospiraceae bacterium OttesenSCG-928-G22]
MQEREVDRCLEKALQISGVVPAIEKVMRLALVADGDRALFRDVLNDALLHHRPSFSMQVHIRTLTAGILLLAVNGQFIYNADGSLGAAYGTFYSIQHLIDYNKYLQINSMKNSVTFLPNRQKFYEDMQAMLSRADAWGHIILIDIENFKSINAAYSHNIGDKVLKEIAQTLSKVAAMHGVVYNYSVDQFIVIAHHASKSEVAALIDSIREYHGTHPITADGLTLPVHFAMAAVDYGASKNTLDELMVDLDITLRKAKTARENKTAFFSLKDRVDYMESFELMAALRRAAEHGCVGFLLRYQPIISHESGLCVGAEALLRWQSESGKVMPPLAIIPLLEQMNLMPTVEAWVIETACRQCGEWIRAGASPSFFMHINLSALQIARPSLPSEMERAIKAGGIGHSNIFLEVTETTAMAEGGKSIAMLEALRGAGMRVAIDDFGTGYSSLSYLRTLPADEIKIDRSFVDRIDENEAARDFLAAVIDLSKSMGFLVCVEGIETEAQASALDGMRIDYLQGYNYSRPLDPDAFFETHVSPS